MTRLILVIVAAALSTPLCAAAPLKLLFARSSSTYWNDFPREVAKMVDGKLTVHIEATATDLETVAWESWTQVTQTLQCRSARRPRPG